MTFNELPYKRADLEAWRKLTEDQTARFLAAKTFEEADTVFIEAETAAAEWSTAVYLGRIRHDIDTRDAFYDAEAAYYNREMPGLQPAFQAWTKATLDSPFRKQLEEKYGSVAFLNAEISMGTFIPELVEDLQKENELVDRYSKLLASAQIPFRGGVYTISQLSPFKSDADDEIRTAAWCAEGEWYNAHGAELDEIYDELVRLRDGMGRKLGYDGHTKLGYCRMQRNCYGTEDVEKFRAAVREHLVPLATRLYEAQAARQGRSFPLNFADKDLSFLSGNPVPVGDPEEILQVADKFYAELSPETDEFWKFMRKHGMLDVESKPGKAAGGYCSWIETMRSPFIFANFNGTSHDVEVVTHEAGHAFDTYTNRDRLPVSTIWPSLEGCEVHSMSMEFFAWPWSEDFFGADARKFRYHHLMHSLVFIPYGTMVDHFQHEIYAHPELTPEERHGVWRDLLGVYMPWVKLGEIPFYGEAKGWQRQTHIYKQPFYYIDYCLAQTVALDFWARLQKDPKAAWETYLRYVRLGGSMTFTELLKTAGLGDPFNGETLRTVCETAKAYLENYDLGDIR